MVIVRFDYSKLRGRIRQLYGTETKFAAVIGMSTVSLSAKLNNKVGWSESEIMKCLELLKIPLKHVTEYFFCIVT